MVKSEESKKKILVVDDEEILRRMLQVMLREHCYLVDTAANGTEAFSMATESSYDFILCDVLMPVLDGVGFLDRATVAGIDATIIMMSTYETIDTAIECMKQGAYDYISKPFKNEEIFLVLRKAEELDLLKSENRKLKEEMRKECSFANMVSRNRKMLEIFSLTRIICDFKTVVLILGESGTGKELIARALHYNSKRRTAPFIAFNCGVIPENLLESELFGHVKGAFTDDSSEKAGLFEKADGGTLFLDEIGEMSLALQVKLLRVLQDGEIMRVGGASAKNVEVRVVSATSKNLEREVAQNRFRKDLFAILNVLSFALPALRERIEDIPLLVDLYLEKYGAEFSKQGMRCSPKVLKVLMTYPWPGNVRELENCIQRGILLCERESLELECLPASVWEKSSGEVAAEFKPVLTEASLSIKRGSVQEREMIRKALAKTSGNRTHAARLLEISLRSLLYKIKDYGIE